MKTVLLLGGALTLAAAAMSAEQRTTERMPSLVTPSLYGRDIFEFYCAPCHGLDGRGRSPVAVGMR